MTAGEHEPETSGRPSSHRDAPQRKVIPALADIRAEWIDFYDANYHRVVRFIMHAGACLQSAQDAVQEAFTESWALVESDPGRWLAISSKEAWIRVVVYRFRTSRRCCDLRFGRKGWLRQDRGSCPFACST
jgi:hypothetical protein